MLTIEDLSVKLGKKTIIQDLSLSMQTNKFVGIIGANGSGKSTLLKTIYKGLTPETGRIIFNDLDLLKTSPKTVAKQMSVVGQFNELSFDFSVFQMVLLGRTPHKKLLESDSKEDYAIVEQALHEMGLTEYRNESYLSLSGGEKQRVILARALAQQPEFLILDEPFTGLDPVNTEIMMSEIKRLRDAGAMIIFSSHNMSGVEKLSDHITMLRHGETVLQGGTNDIRESFGRTEIYLESPVTTEQLLALPGVIDVQSQGAGRHLNLADAKVGQDVFKLVSQTGYVPVFAQQPPTLDEIFRRAVQGEEVQR